MDSVLAYLDRITNAPSMEALWNTHLEAMAGYGFDRLIYGFTRYRSGRSLGDPQDWIVLTNQPRAYMSPFVDDGMYFNGPMLRWALENEGACSWSWLAQRVAEGALSPAEMRVLEFNRRLGVTAGYTISFRTVSTRTKGAIALIARPGTGQDEVDANWARSGQEIMILNNAAHLKIQTLPWTGSRQLTSRQREVLQWVGDGKTAQDIALLMGLTPATVEKHLRLAREALDVETTAQAVLKAAFQNQMFTAQA